jgi:uracil-DNA glycosylase
MEDTTSKEKVAPFEPGWQLVLGQELEKDYMKSLKAFLLREKEQGYTIYPKNAEIFNAFKHTHFDQVKVVILGQDPYHGPGQAHGLAFSVQEGVQIPPSLRNIFKELETDIPGFKKPNHGSLMQWADRGVLLLNATLTVRAQQAGSHQNKGWEIFTDHVITTLSAKKEGLVFILWGRYAHNKSVLIDGSRHTILKAAHPSPLSAYNGFFGCKHFSLTNASLQEKGLEPIDWRIT